MPIDVRCHACQQAMRAPDTAAGKRVRCPKCQTVISVPAPAAPPPPAPPPPSGVGDLLDEYTAIDQAKQQAQAGAMMRDQQERERQRRLAAKLAAEPTVSTASDDDGMEIPWGWVAFFLIFVGGNIVLYLTTGFVIIPRR